MRLYRSRKLHEHFVNINSALALIDWRLSGRANPDAAKLKWRKAGQIRWHLAGANGMLSGSGPCGEISARAQSGPTENRLDRGRSSQFPGVDPVWHYGFLFSPALTIGGGTFAIQRNIVAEHVLGLPRDIDPDRGLTWSQTRQRQH